MKTHSQSTRRPRLLIFLFALLAFCQPLLAGGDAASFWARPLPPWQNSSVSDMYYIVPTRAGNGFGYLVFTNSCRASHGCEAVLQYGGGTEAMFSLFDWSIYYDKVGNPYAKQINLPTANPQYLTQRPDQFGVVRQMLRVRNGSYYLGPVDGRYKFQNKIELFDFVRGDWDVFHSRDHYAQTEAEAASWRGEASSLAWMPMVETFDNYANKMTEVLGCDLARMFYDGAPLWQTPDNTRANLAPVGQTKKLDDGYWLTLSHAPHTHFAVALTTSTHQVTVAPPMGTLCVTANTNAGGFTLSSASGVIDPYWVSTPDGQWWDKTVGQLPPGNYSIAFDPVPGMSTPSGQIFQITANNVTTVKGVYGDNIDAPPVVILSSPQDRQTLWGESLSATALVAAGTPPYTVTYYTSSGVGEYSAVGVATAAPYTVSLNALPIGTYQLYAQVTDSSTPVARTATSPVQTIYVSPIHTWTNEATSGNWSDPLSWEGAAVPASGASVVFGTGGSTCVVDSVSRSVGTILFNRAANFTLSVSGGAGLTLNGGVSTSSNFTHTISAPITLGGDNVWTVNTGTLQASGAITGNASLTKAGSGRLTLSNSNNFNGGVTHNAGDLRVGHNAALGSGTLTLNGGSLSAASESTTISNINSIVVNGLSSLSGMNTGTSPMTLNTPITVPVYGYLVMGNPISGPGGLNALDIIFKNVVGVTYRTTLTAPITLRGNQTVSGSGSIITGEIGDGGQGHGLNVAVSDVWGGWGGKLAFNAANTYRGDTTVSSGLLQINHNLALQNSALQTALGIASLSRTTPTLGGLKGGTDLASVFTSGYGAVTALTLNPLSGTCTYSGAIANGAANMTLTKSGDGTQVLAGPITSTGAVHINAGTLILDGTHTGGAAVTVQSAARLGGNGSTTSIVTVQSGGKLLANVSDWDAGTCSNLTVSNLNLPSTWSLDVTAAGFTETNKTFPFLAATGSISGFAAPTVSGPGAGTWQVRQSPSDAKILELVYTAANGNPSTLDLVSSFNPAPEGQNVTFTATVKDGEVTAVAATGTCAFRVDGVVVATVPVSGGSASYSTSNLAPGPHTIMATYSGDGSYATSSASLTQTSVTANPIVPIHTTRSDGKTVAKFTSGSGFWTVPAGVTSVEVLAIGGGGGGGSYIGGGGGAGGFIYQSSVSVSPHAEIPITVGSGGFGGLNNLAAFQGRNGGDSVFGTLTALGGGGGGGVNGFQNLATLAGLDGGSGGGGANSSAAGAGLQSGSASGGFGNAGFGNLAFGGGGGAGAASGGVHGGTGLQHPITGTPTWYAAGGGGRGGLGGSGIGGSNSGSWGSTGTSGAANTGSGGGAGNGNTAGNGGSGVVIVTYFESTATTHAVNFDSTGGSAIPSQLVADGYTTSPPASPIKSGYTFAAWYADPALTTPFDFNSPITADTTLHAKWITNWTVTFESNGGSVIPSLSVADGSTATEPTAPTKAGFGFIAWCSDVALTTPFNFNTPITADITLYAKWGSSYTWTPTAAGSYHWNNAEAQNNWTSGFPNAVGDAANLNINLAGAQTILLNQAITVGAINIGDTASTYYSTTLSANGGSLIMDVGAGNATISKATAANNVTDTIAADILLHHNLVVHNAATGGLLTIDGVISGEGKSMEKTGAGTLRISKANSYNGTTTITAGTLQLGSGATGGNGLVAGNIINNATLNFNNANAQTFSGANYSGSGILSKTAGGNLTLTGTTTARSLQLGYRAAGGTLTVGSGASLFVGSGASDHLLVGTVYASSTGGSGTLNVSASANFTVNVGNLYVGVYTTNNPAGTGTSSTGATANGTLSLGASNTIAASNRIIVGGTQPDNDGPINNIGTITTVANSGTTITTPYFALGTAKGTGTFTLGTNATLNLGNPDSRTELVIGRSETGNGYDRPGTGNMNLAAGTANLYLNKLWIGRKTVSGNTTSTEGTLTLRDASNHLDIIGSGSVVNIGYTEVANMKSKGTLTIGNLDATSSITTDSATDAAVRLGAGALGEGTLNLNGGTLRITTGGSAAIAGGGGTVSALNFASNSSVTLIAGSDSPDWIKDLSVANIEIHGLTLDTAGFSLGVSQSFSGTGSLTKSGLGTLTLTGTSSYTGDTNVTGGTLVIDGENTATTGALTVSNNARLGGNGGTAAAVTVETGGKLLANISDWNGAPGTGFTDLSVGSLALAGTWTLDVTLLASYANFSESNRTFPILTATGGISGFDAANVTVAADSFPGTGTWSVQKTGNALELVYTVASVPVDDYVNWDNGYAADLSDKNADNDGDGLSNFAEYAFGLDPTSGASSNPIAVSLDPTTKKFRYSRREGSGLNYTVETTTTLQENDWTNPAAATQIVVDTANGIETVEVELLSPPSGDKLFVRVKAQ